MNRKPSPLPPPAVSRRSRANSCATPIPAGGGELYSLHRGSHLGCWRMPLRAPSALGREEPREPFAKPCAVDPISFPWIQKWIYRATGWMIFSLGHAVMHRGFPVLQSTGHRACPWWQSGCSHGPNAGDGLTKPITSSQRATLSANLPAPTRTSGPSEGVPLRKLSGISDSGISRFYLFAALWQDGPS